MSDLSSKHATNVLIAMRPATSADEAFVLSLEESCLRSQSVDARGRWVSRPGMGEIFPGACRIIQHDGRDVGCLTVLEDKGGLHIDQFYVMASARNMGIGQHILNGLISRASGSTASIRIAVFANSPFVSFFQRSGFGIAGTTRHKILLQRPSHSC
jgi:GNAT superfamily N-acetyltransferase